jgi:hypothetical protein
MAKSPRVSDSLVLVIYFTETSGMHSLKISQVMWNASFNQFKKPCSSRHPSSQTRISIVFQWTTKNGMNVSLAIEAVIMHLMVFSNRRMEDLIQ